LAASLNSLPARGAPVSLSLAVRTRSSKTQRLQDDDVGLSLDGDDAMVLGPSLSLSSASPFASLSSVPWRSRRGKPQGVATGCGGGLGEEAEWPSYVVAAQG
jgi:hypothetical protein